MSSDDEDMSDIQFHDQFHDLRASRSSQQPLPSLSDDIPSAVKQLRSAFDGEGWAGVAKVLDSLTLTSEKLGTLLLKENFKGTTTLLHAAAIDCQVQTAEKILELANRATLKAAAVRDRLLSAVDAEGDTPLHCAAQNAHDSMLTLLLGKGANVNAVNRRTGFTPLFKAVSCDGEVSTCRILIEQRADLSIRCKEGYTALHWTLDKHTHQSKQLGSISGSVASEIAAIAKLLLQHEPELASCQCNYGGAPLDWLLARSANFQSTKSVEDLAGLLIEHGADPYKKSDLLKNMRDQQLGGSTTAAALAKHLKIKLACAPKRKQPASAPASAAASSSGTSIAAQAPSNDDVPATPSQAARVGLAQRRLAQLQDPNAAVTIVEMQTELRELGLDRHGDAQKMRRRLIAHYGGSEEGQTPSPGKRKQRECAPAPASASTASNASAARRTPTTFGGAVGAVDDEDDDEARMGDDTDDDEVVEVDSEPEAHPAKQPRTGSETPVAAAQPVVAAPSAVSHPSDLPSLLGKLAKLRELIQPTATNFCETRWEEQHCAQLYAQGGELFLIDSDRLKAERTRAKSDENGVAFVKLLHHETAHQCSDIKVETTSQHGRESRRTDRLQPGQGSSAGRDEDSRKLERKLTAFLNKKHPGACHPDLEVVAVGSNDAREQLRGQSKVVLARGELQTNDVLGIYTGRMTFPSDTQDTGPILEVGRRATYVYQFHPGADHVVSHTLPHEKETLIVQPFPKYGNKLMVINDKKNSGKHANCKFLEFMHLGFPAVAKIVIRPVKAGDELLTDYGPSFWNQESVLEETYGQPMQHFGDTALPLLQSLEDGLAALNGSA
tara:strand:+ start:102 stop:2612 length:2511 start_codon:yes stop_codon:yes gene_type:complete